MDRSVAFVRLIECEAIFDSNGQEFLMPAAAGMIVLLAFRPGVNDFFFLYSDSSTIVAT